MSVRAGIVVTGTEVLTGRIQDRNGPWLAEQLLELGVEPAHITICGDHSADIQAQLRFLTDQKVNLIITTGGLGPTADDMTVATVAAFCHRELILDEPLENTIANILRSLRTSRASQSLSSDADFDAVRAANRKQALVPAGAHILTPVGTAPGVVVPGTPPIIVLPGPPRELQAMWPQALATDVVQQAIAERTQYRHATIRMFGLPESLLAQTLRHAEQHIAGFDSLEITTCLRRGELEIVTRYQPDHHDIYRELAAVLQQHHGDVIFSEDGSLIDDQVANLLAGRRIATAESCTAGLLAARLTDQPGSSSYVAGSVVAYSNDIKHELLGVDAALITSHGAVSGEVAEAMAYGALGRFNADTAVAITGIAGPGGGSAEKPVGTVWFSVALADHHENAGQDGTAFSAPLTRMVRLLGDRSDIRQRSTTVAMHLLRRALLTPQ